jgi:hypothetical protein
MSIIPELILQQMLVKGIRAFREDERLLRMLFRNFTLEETEAIQKFLRDDSIDISLNYPDADVKLPCVVILMKSESEDQAFLRDFQQSDSDWLDNVPLTKAELRGDQTTLGSGSQTTLGEPGKLLLDPTTAIGGTSDSIIAPEGTTGLIDPYEETVYVVTMEGTAAGQRRLVTSITPSQIEQGVEIVVDDPWIVIPDDTTIFKLVGAPTEPEEQVVGEWPKLYDTDSGLERFGAIYRVSYQLGIYASDQEMVIILYNLFKAIVISSRKFLLKNGFLSVQMAGTDMIPVSDMYPQLAYSRSLTLDFRYHYDVFVTIAEELATSIVIDLAVHTPDVQDPDDVERVVSETTIDLS